jgi:hypothetical protein
VPALLCRRKRPCRDFHHASRIVDFHGELRHRAEHGAIVQLLKAFAAAIATRDLTDEQDQRRRILRSRVHTDARMGGAGAARDKAHAGFAGRFRIADGHVRCAGFVAAGDQFHAIPKVHEGIEDRQIALARYAKDVRNVVGDDGFDQTARRGGGDGMRHDVARMGKQMRNVRRSSCGVTAARIG